MMRRIAMNYDELLKRIEELEINTDAQFNEIYQALTQLLGSAEEQKNRRPIGYRQPNQSKTAANSLTNPISHSDTETTNTATRPSTAPTPSKNLPSRKK